MVYQSSEIGDLESRQSLNGVSTVIVDGQCAKGYQGLGTEAE